MKNLLLTLEYDGSRYQGWQRPGDPLSPKTISGRLLRVLERLTGEEIRLACGQKTEAGVHAYGQAVSFQTAFGGSPEELMADLNRYLPLDIAVRKIQQMPRRFNAALNATERCFTYQVTTGPLPDLFRRKYTLHLPEPLDLPAMEAAAEILRGQHDLSPFSPGKHRHSTQRNLEEIRLISSPAQLAIHLRGDGFLRGMARTLVSTLLEAGRGRLDPSAVEGIFQGALAAPAPCDPRGLILTQVLY